MVEFQYIVIIIINWLVYFQLKLTELQTINIEDFVVFMQGIS